MEIKKKLGNKKIFDCDICYMECEMKEIAYLKMCGHFFCRSCLSDYYNFMVNSSGQIHKMKCPNVSCP